jgi:Sec-independent protein translocase protein TatA
VIALIGNFDFTELLVIAVVALMAFGRNLPQVAMRAAVQLARARRALMAMWREAGLEDELRRVRREVEREVNLPKLQAPQKMARDAGRRYMQDIQAKLDADPEPKVSAPSPPPETTQARIDGPAPETRHDPSPEAPPPSAPAAPGVDLTPRPVRKDTTPRDDRREDRPAATRSEDSDQDRETA